MSESDKSVVVGYDGSPGAEAAVAWAAVEANRLRAALTVLVATDPVREVTQLLSLSGVKGGTHEEEAEELANTGVEFARSGVPSVQVTSRVSAMGAVSALCEAAQVASLVVVGSMGHGRGLHALLGSTAFAVVTHSDASVVAVRGDPLRHAGPEHPVVVGVDGSAGSNAAVDRAADFAAEAGAELVLVSAWETPMSNHWSRIYLDDDEWRKEDNDRVRNDAHMLVGQARNRALERHADLVIGEVVTQGRPEKVIAHGHEAAAIVMVGARGYGDFSSLLLGSVSRGVVHLARCPVAIIR